MRHKIPVIISSVGCFALAATRYEVTVAGRDALISTQKTTAALRAAVVFLSRHGQRTTLPLTRTIRYRPLHPDAVSPR